MASVTIIPNGYTHTGDYNFTVDTSNTSRRISNAYNNADNTSSSARLTLASNRQSARTSTMYLEFNKSALDDIPSGATINSVTANVRYYVNNTTYVTAVSVQLHANTTAKGNAVTTRSTSSAKYAITPGSWTLAELKTARLYISATHNTSTSTAYLYLYGADITITYTAEDVHPTSVTLDYNTASLEEGDTIQLTETVLPSNATNKSVTWSSSNTSVATVSGGLVTAVSAGSATITVTTVDGSKTATCAVTVTQAVLVDYVQTDSLVPGKTYVIANGNTGSVYVMSNEAGGARQLKGISATISNGKLRIKQSVELDVTFNCALYDSSNSITTRLENGGKYLYSNNSNGLVLNTTCTDRFWHLENGKFWLFKSTTADGYTDTSSEYKYYIEVTNGYFTDNHVTSPSIADTTIPSIYLFIRDEGTQMNVRVKNNGSWVTPTKVLVKSNGTWHEASKVLVKDGGSWKG